MHLFASQQTRAIKIRFSNQPIGVERFRTIHDRGVDVACGLKQGEAFFRRRFLVSPGLIRRLRVRWSVGW